MHSTRVRRWVPLALLLALVVAPARWPLASADPAPADSDAAAVAVPPVLGGDTWLTHHHDDLMPYWELPEALGDPVGNFPTYRGRNGALLPESTDRAVAALGRQVYGYSLAFMLTGQPRYLTWARAGLDWIEAKAEDPVHGGYFGDLDANGDPVDPVANKDVFDLASVGLGYAMYFNATRDPEAEAKLLDIRDLLFDKYYDPATNRVKDSLTYDLSTEVDTSNNGGDITDYLVPGTAMFLPTLSILSDPDRRAQFRDDLRHLTQALIDRHKNTAAATNKWMFWGETLRFGSFNAQRTDFGHNILSYAMIHNANQMFPDRPWDGLAADRTTMLTRAWDDAASRWNERPKGFGVNNVERDSGWWIHDEADQLLATLDLGNGFPNRDQLARSAQTFLDVYVDRDPAYPARETFTRIDRTGENTNLRKSAPGKNMLHNDEHALVMYLHGRAMEDRPARLYYALPQDQALTAVAKPYWFDATTESRTDTGPLAALPGHDLVAVDFSGIGQVPRPPYPAPADTTAPVTTATVTPAANTAGWHRGDVTVSLAAADDLVGVKEVHARVEDLSGATPGFAWIRPGGDLTLPTFTGEGEYDVTYFAVDALGNSETPHVLHVRIDRTAPTLSGLPPQPCTLWPPNHEMVHVADVVGDDSGSGVDTVAVTGTSDEPGSDDIRIVGGSVDLRAERDGAGDGRVYTLRATVTDRAGNTTSQTATCTVPHDQGR